MTATTANFAIGPDTQFITGALFGSLVGDALGVPVEFQTRAAREADPVTGMRGYGTWNQPPGTWSDDGSLLLCAVESLAERGFDTADMAERFVRWYRVAHWSALGDVFDVGNATSLALERVRRGVPAEEAGGCAVSDNGNGSLMRILPVALASYREPEAVFCERLVRASAITHGHAISRMVCVFHGLFARSLLEGRAPDAALTEAQARFAARYSDALDLACFQHLLRADFAETPIMDIDSGGYVMDTLTASLWCLLTTTGFSECVLRAVNLGGDTDTTGCVAGGLAGLVYGVDGIPREWREALPRQADLGELFQRFHTNVF